MRKNSIVFRRQIVEKQKNVSLAFSHNYMPFLALFLGVLCALAVPYELFDIVAESAGIHFIPPAKSIVR